MVIRVKSANPVTLTPQGLPGPPGTNPIADWASLADGALILLRDETYDNGSAWLCVAQHTKTADKRPPALPATSNAWWRLRARGANDAAVNAVAGIAQQVTAVAGNAVNINAVAGEIGAVAEVADNMEAVLLAASSAIDGGSATTAFTAAQALDGGNANG